MSTNSTSNTAKTRSETENKSKKPHLAAVNLEDFSRGYKETLKATQQQFSESSNKLIESCEEGQNASKQALEQLLGSNHKISQGFDRLSREQFAVYQRLFSSYVAAYKTIASAGSLKEVSEVQSKFLTEELGQVFGEYAKISSITIDLFGQALQPLQKGVEQYAQAITEAQKHFAA